jgi:hypothetical protein
VHALLEKTPNSASGENVLQVCEEKMSLDYVRTTYGSKVKRGMKVLCLGKDPGIAVSADYLINVRLIGDKRPRPYHPFDVVPLEE